MIRDRRSDAPRLAGEIGGGGSFRDPIPARQT